MSPSEHRPPSTVYRALRSYFRSGWAFLIPYLAAYLLYAWLEWPVNAGGAGEGLGIGESGTPLTPLLPHSLIPSPSLPSLLHVYWFLHVAHTILAGVALWHWWRASGATVTGATNDSVNAPNRAAQSQPATVPQSGNRPPLASPKSRALGAPVSDLRPPPPLTAYRLPLTARVTKTAPWVLLALLFWIPGIYLEWPSDPWEHLRRINEWHAHSLVTEHSAWQKSSYFLPYSLTGFTTGLTQLSWLNFYYTGICLLLSWQYYRLARAVGLSERASFIFVLINALTFGNNIFSFYRYYGLSSSIFAQLGAVALTSIVLESSKLGTSGLATGGLARPTEAPVTSLPTTRYSLLRLGAAALCLLPLIALNHPQGLGIAGLGVMAVIVWRLIEWKRSMIGWLALAAVVLSAATVLWFPRHPAIDEIYRPQGWLNGWYGFNLFATDSPAVGRSLHILGAFGVLNLALGLWLIVRRNHVAGWLTILPVIALSLPCFAVPFAYVLAAFSYDAGNIVTFHRMLLAVPSGLATLCIITSLARSIESQFSPCFLTRMGSVFLVCIGLTMMLAEPGRPYFQRTWDVMRSMPEDLEFREMLESYSLLPTEKFHGAGLEPNQIISEAENYMVTTFTPNHTNMPTAHRQIQYRHTASLDRLLAKLTTSPPRSADQVQVINADPTTRDPSEWVISASTSEPIIVAAVDDFPPSPTAFQNAVGVSVEFFNAAFIEISTNTTYKLEASLRRLSPVRGRVYLAIAWYDANKRLLPAFAAAPEGAGSPQGWNNGTYSYYGAAGDSPPQSWTTYRTSFGPAGYGSIPFNARYMRIGALLNYDSATGSIIQATNFLLWTEPTGHTDNDGVFSPHVSRLIYVCEPRLLSSAQSMAGYLSGHWQPHEAALLLAGYQEIIAAAQKTAHYYSNSQLIVLDRLENKLVRKVRPVAASSP